MRMLLAGFVLLLGLLAVSPAQSAIGLVNFSWNACAPVVQDRTVSFPLVLHLYVSVAGFDQPHRGSHTRVLYGDETGGVPDCWRYDAEGCQTEALISIRNVPTPTEAATCPAFQQGVPSVPTVVITRLPGPEIQLEFTNRYATTVQAVNPAIRYFLTRVDFDHTFSVQGPTHPLIDCGGYEHSLCFVLTTAGWIDPGGVEHAFGRNAPAGMAQYVTFNGGAGCANGPTPARPATWGAIRAQYRN